MQLIKNQSVGASLLDAGCKLSTVGAFQLIQDAITELMGLHKIDGVTVKREYDAFWVFIKTRVKFGAKVEWCETLTVNAFFSHISAAKIAVDVEIKKANGELAVFSRTEICALDLTTQRIRRLSSVGVKSDMLEQREFGEVKFASFEDVELPIVDTVTVRSTNIDFSHHTNNEEYVRLIMNTYSVAQLEALDIKEMEMIYAGQSHENDVLQIRKAAIDGKHIIAIENSGAPVVKCEMICGGGKA